MSESGFPIGEMSLRTFCGIINDHQSIQNASIVRVDWLQKKSWPLYHQYLLIMATHAGRQYELRIETLGRINQTQRVVQLLALNALYADSLGDAKFQVRIRELASRSSEFTEQGHPANLIASMMSSYDLPSRYMESPSIRDGNQYFTCSVPPHCPTVDTRDPPDMRRLCQTLSSIARRAPDYTLRAQHCYFLCRMTVFGLWGLSAPLTHLVWTQRAGYTPAKASEAGLVSYVDGLPEEQLRPIVIFGWGLVQLVMPYQSNMMRVAVFLLWVPVIAAAIYAITVATTSLRTAPLWLFLLGQVYMLATLLIPVARLCKARDMIKRLHEVQDQIAGDLGITSPPLGLSEAEWWMSVSGGPKRVLYR